MTKSPRRRTALPVEVLESRTMLDVTFNVDTTTGQQPISPCIYGINYGQVGFSAYTFARVGGNRWTAYNWTTNASNAGSDWYYSNDNLLSSSKTPGAAVANIIVDAGNHRVPLVLTVPMAGYVSADENGNVDITDPNRFTTRFVPEYARKGAPFTLTPSQTGPVYEDEFVNWVKQTYPATQTDPSRPIWYSLDNEPDLWSSTHAEVHPNPATYAEIIQDTITYASAIKDVSAISLVFGPVNYGWAGMMNFQGAPDASVAGSLTFQQYYLQQVHAAEVQAGRKLLDVDDVHYYSEATDTNGVRVTNGNTDAAAIAARVQSARSLYDPTYVESSWITQYSTGGKPIDLLQRMNNDIATYDPGTKTSLTEWSFGAGNNISGGIADAEALGAYGKMGVFAASYWQTESDTRYTVSAFNMYRNFDGVGSTFGDTSTNASTSSMNDSAIFASVDSSDPNKIVLVAINRDPTALTGHFNLTLPGTLVSGRWYALTGSGSAIQNMGDMTFTGSGTFNLTMPAYSVNTISLRIAPAGTVATPTFSVVPGNYSSTQTVSIACGTASSVIRYTTDGSLPTSTNGTIYSGPLSISTQTVLRAMAYATGKTDSAVRTGSYTFLTPVVTYLYQDSFATGWNSGWSWNCTHNDANTSPVKNGTHSIAVTYTAGNGALSVDGATAISTTGFTALKFWVNGGSGSNKQAEFYSQTGDTSGNSTAVSFTATTGTWTEITIPLSSLGNPGTIKRINFQDTTGGAQGTYYIDDIRLVAGSAPPFIIASNINNDAVQRSTLTKLSVVFDEGVRLSTGAFTLLNRAGAVIPNVTLNAVSSSGDPAVWDITFSGSGLQNGSLPDGTYRLRVTASAVQDAAASLMAADYRLHFWRLFGDSNGDRQVDRTDLIAFRAALNAPANYVSYFDFDGSGTITATDYAQFRKRLLRRLI